MDPSLAALAQLLKSTQSRRVEENRPATSSVSIRATPPQLPAFQIPGMNAQGLQGLAQAARGANPAGGATGGFAPPDVARATTPPPVVPSGNQPGVVPPTPNSGALPPLQNGGMVANAPNFMPVPQTAPDLETWRKLMDQMQMARQGA